MPSTLKFQGLEGLTIDLQDETVGRCTVSYCGPEYILVNEESISHLSLTVLTMPYNLYES